MSKYPNLFSPIKIGKLELKNRGVMPPMVTNLSNEDGTASQRLIDYIGARADGGVGLVILEAVCISPEGRGFPNMTNIDMDSTIPGLSKVTQRAHDGGAKICAQLIHCGRQANPMVTGMSVVAPSPIPCPVVQAPPHGLSKDEIKEIAVKFADAAERAKRAGFDMVELHGAHGYLLNQFLSPFSNQRTDEYGGSLENRARFPLEVYTAARERVGADFPIIYRITSEEFLDGSLHLDEVMEFCKMLADKGIDGIHVSGGNYASGRVASGPEDPMGFYADNAAAIRKAIGAKVPIIVANRIRTPELAEEIISQGKADMVATGRTLICDPDFYNKAESGVAEDIRECTSCSYCLDLLNMGQPIACLHNPLVGREGQFDLSKKTSLPRKLVVVGGGPAGMEAACTAAMLGHDVTLLESKGVLGGNVVPGTKPPYKDEIGFVVDYRVHMLHKLGVDVKLNTPADMASIQALQPDMVFVASGSVPLIPAIPGADGADVVTAEQILLGEKQAGNKVVVIGGGSVGVETGELLADQGSDVTVIEMLDDILTDVTPGMKAALMMRAHQKLNIKTQEKVSAIKPGLVETDKAGYQADTVVLAVGYKPVDELSEALKQQGLNVRVIGDANKPRKINDAVMEGFDAAYEL